MSYDPKKDKIVKVDDKPAAWTVEVDDLEIEIAVKRYADGPPRVAYTKLGDEPEALRRQTGPIAVAIGKCVTKNADTILAACVVEEEESEEDEPSEEAPKPAKKKRAAKD